jgi:hypothetical protein
MFVVVHIVFNFPQIYIYIQCHGQNIGPQNKTCGCNNLSIVDLKMYLYMINVYMPIVMWDFFSYCSLLTMLLIIPTPLPIKP